MWPSVIDCVWLECQTKPRANGRLSCHLSFLAGSQSLPTPCCTMLGWGSVDPTYPGPSRLSHCLPKAPLSSPSRPPRPPSPLVDPSPLLTSQTSLLRSHETTTRRWLAKRIATSRLSTTTVRKSVCIADDCDDDACVCVVYE